MTKAELVAIVAEKCGGKSKGEVSEIFDQIWETILRALEVEGRFQVSNFGTFEVRHRKARVARNPRTHESIEVPATRKVAFRPAATLKDRFAGEK